MRTPAFVAVLLSSSVCLAADAPLLPLAAQHPAMRNAPRLSRTGLGILGDPINVGLIGTRDELIAAMLEARWQPADPITFQSAVKIAKSVLLQSPYETAPISHLYVNGRKQDLAFQQQVGKDARRRHHVRFWQSKLTDEEGRPLWFAAATFDTDVGLSRKTGLITHHIDADIDAERDKIMGDLVAAGMVVRAELVEGFQLNRDGRNGGGDKYHTDRRLSLGLLKHQAEQSRKASVELRR